jgi:hypothetical protein
MEYLYKYISSNATHTVSTRPVGVLHSVTIGETAAGAITISDDSGTIAVLKSGIAEGTYEFNVSYRGSLKVVTAAASKITVAYN